MPEPRRDHTSRPVRWGAWLARLAIALTAAAFLLAVATCCTMIVPDWFK